MHASSWLPWIFFGPLLIAVSSGVAYSVTRIALLATLAQVALAVTFLVGILAFWAARKAQKSVSADANPD